jgi:hypothetical protein
MDRQQQEKAKRVWQRVSGQAAPMPAQRREGSALKEEVEALALLNRLAQIAPADHKQLFRQLYTRQQSSVSVLKGLEKMQNMHADPAAEKLPENMGLKQGLYLVFGKNQGLISRYSQLVGSEQWGYAYSYLLEQKKDQNIALLKILGTT